MHHQTLKLASMLLVLIIILTPDDALAASRRRKGKSPCSKSHDVYPRPLQFAKQERSISYDVYRFISNLHL